MPSTGIAGILVVDKPAGPTSFDVVAAVRRALGVRRAGHTGTLDPFATGVLAVCVGEATKLVPYLSGGTKEYEATVRLGQATDTLDPTGRVVEEVPDSDLPELSVEAVRAAAARFVGRIAQTPPVFSAIKAGGTPLYRRARRGEKVEVAAREVEVHAIEVLAVRRTEVDLLVRCGPGTYVRSLARDLGAALGLPAHLQRLRRTRTGPFGLDQAVPGSELPLGERGKRPREAPLWSREALRERMVPAAAALIATGMPPVEVAARDEGALRQGQAVCPASPLPASSDLVAIVTADGFLVGVGRREADHVRPVRLVRRPDPPGP